MRVMIDTHIFLWFIDDSPKLSPAALSIIKDTNNEVLLSIASLWEMAIKHSIGKLNFRQEFAHFIRKQIALNDIKLLPVNIDHVIASSALPLHHRDPFDRMLIAQSLVENIPIVSTDASFDAYTVNRLW